MYIFKNYICIGGMRNLVVTELEASNDGIQLFHEGTLYDSYKFLGAHLIKLNDKTLYSIFCLGSSMQKK